MLDRRYLVKWFRAGALTSTGGGPENDRWPALTSAAYIARKRRLGKNQKLRFDGTLRLSYFARPLPNGKGLITGVADPNRQKLQGLSGLGFNLMTLEPSVRKQIFKNWSRYLATGKL